MEANASPSSHGVPAWLVRFCKLLSTVRGLIWSSIFNIVLSLLSTLLFTAIDSDFGKFPITFLFQHWKITVTTFIVLALLTGLVWAIGQLPIVESSATLKRQYLTRRILQTQDLAIEGIPLLPPRVQLDEIFIPMQLRPHQSDIDQLLTQEQSKLLREGIRRGKVAKNVEHVLIDAERQYERLLKGSDKIEIQDLWQRLTKDHPAAVIQGYPGMGKSTLLLRLTLYMARRGRGKTDPLAKQVSPVLIPIFIRLGRYASFLGQQTKNGQDSSLWKYLSSAPKELDELATPGMLPWLSRCLERGQCFVLFDGLDEVSDPIERFEVQEAIKSFIEDVCSKASDKTSYNHFLITSRVAGYDQNAFPGYPHYTIAELTPEQIKAFLPRWCRASARSGVQGLPAEEKTHTEETKERLFTQEESEEYITRQAAAIEQRLNNAIQSHQGIRELVQNPFLLTLLAIMQQMGIELPSRRFELYTTLTKILLETRNARRGLPVIPEAQAIQRLGPIAYQMQETQNSFATRSGVLASFAKTIEGIDNVLLEQGQKEAEVFLDRMRERGGIFVLRTGDYYGFFHRTFQEYFAARQILRRMATDPDEIDDLVQKARQQDDLWREPFLLAVAYKTNDEAPVACEIIRKLIVFPQGTAKEQRYHDALLAGECLLEAKESTIRPDLECEVVLALVQVYEDAQRFKDFDICQQVEKVMQRLLLAVSREAEHSPLLATFQETILDIQYASRQRVVLTMLTMIAQDLRACAPVVFNKIVPPLLGLTGLPEVGCFQPLSPSISPDLDIIDLALAALSFLGAGGPAGASLKQVRPRFEQHLQQLAEYSLRLDGTLITPVVVPLREENYSRYEKCVKQWYELYDDVQRRKRVTEKDKNACINIHQQLLESAEEVCYPAETHILGMLQHSQSHPDQPGQATWQAYLREQMITGTYIDYQSCALLWATLFPEEQAQRKLASVLLEHFSDNTKLQRYAQRF
ncbi:MAG TPA: NACHT domain-containing protein, partial [Ktedonobacteraceae bacterium]